MMPTRLCSQANKIRRGLECCSVVQQALTTQSLLEALGSIAGKGRLF